MLPPKTIITPHAGEFDRLFGEHTCAEERLKKAVEKARYYNIIIVLKGHHTMIVRPTGKVHINSTGNAGMATAGSGDAPRAPLPLSWHRVTVRSLPPPLPFTFTVWRATWPPRRWVSSASLPTMWPRTWAEPSTWC